MQPDGNLVVYTAEEDAIWSSRTNGNPLAVCHMQEDGNLVIYLGRKPLWSSNTYGARMSGLHVQEDGKLVIYNQDGTAVWASSETSRRLRPGEHCVIFGDLKIDEKYYCPNGSSYVVMQSDGNLVVYRSNGEAAWSSDTHDNAGATCQMQQDGNLCVYQGKRCIWASGTRWAGACLAMQNNGNLCVYDTRGVCQWASGTDQCEPGEVVGLPERKQARVAE
jgi:D-mannose binding lectin.